MNDEQLKELRELAYGMSVGNLNPEDVVDYMAIASACARMESRRAVHRMGCIGVDQSTPNSAICVNFAGKRNEGTEADE
jgi:hypothetical protein